jgi:hypothetical protein
MNNLKQHSSPPSQRGCYKRSTLLKPLATVFLLSFIVSSSVEGRVYSHTRPQVSSIKRKAPTKLAPTRNLSSQRKKQVVTQRRPQHPLVAKRPQAQRALIAKRPPVRKPIAAQKAPQKATPVNKRQVVAKKIPPRTVVRARPQIKQTAFQRKRNLPTKTTPTVRQRQTANPRPQYQQKASIRQKVQSRLRFVLPHSDLLLKAYRGLLLLHFLDCEKAKETNSLFFWEYFY